MLESAMDVFSDLLVFLALVAAVLITAGGHLLGASC
jgi:hypothetical protein